MIASRFWFSFFVSLTCMGAIGSTCAQDYPNKPVRLIVANSPGTSGDLAARVLAAEMAKFLGQPMVVENKPGAASIIGYEYVAKQMPPDGYTIAFGSVSILAILPVTAKDLRFDPLKDLPPAIGLVEGRLIFGSSSQLPWATFEEMVANAKANPGKLNSGSPAPNIRLLTEAIIRDLGLSVVHVPYSSGGGYVQALRTGEIQMGLVSESSAISYGDKFRVLAVTGDKRHSLYPQAPTFTEIGLPQIRGISYSLNVRAGTPKPIVDKLYAAASAALQQPDLKTRLAAMQLDIVDQPPEIAARNLAEEAKLYADIGKKIGLRAE